MDEKMGILVEGLSLIRMWAEENNEPVPEVHLVYENFHPAAEARYQIRRGMEPELIYGGRSRGAAKIAGVAVRVGMDATVPSTERRFEEVPI